MKGFFACQLLLLNHHFPALASSLPRLTYKFVCNVYSLVLCYPIFYFLFWFFFTLSFLLFSHECPNFIGVNIHGKPIMSNVDTLNSNYRRFIIYQT